MSYQLSDPEDFGIDTQTGKYIIPEISLPTMAESSTSTWDIRKTERGFFAIMRDHNGTDFKAQTWPALKHKLSCFCGRGNVVYK